jgi:hypothetical protein
MGSISWAYAAEIQNSILCLSGIWTDSDGVRCDKKQTTKIRQNKLNESALKLTNLNSQLHTELWISWASLLRSYAAAHGLNSIQFAVIEFGDNEIILRIDSKWTRFTHTEQHSSNGTKSPFALNEDGTISLDGKIEEIDFAAERITRELMSA